MKIQKGSLLPMKRVKEINNFYKLLLEQGFNFETTKKGDLVEKVNLKKIHNDVFDNKEFFLEKLYQSCFDDELLFDENVQRHAEINDIIEKYYREHGVSIGDIYKLESCLFN